VKKADNNAIYPLGRDGVNSAGRCAVGSEEGNGLWDIGGEGGGLYVTRGAYSVRGGAVLISEGAKSS